MSAALFSILTDDDRRRGAELPYAFGQTIFYVQGRGWVSLPRLASDASLVGGDDDPLDDLDHDRVLTLEAEAIKDSIVDAARVNAQLLGRDRRFRVVHGAGDCGFGRGHVAAIGEGQLDRQIAGQCEQEHVHQLRSGKNGLKVGLLGHGRFSGLVARIKAVLRGRVE